MVMNRDIQMLKVFQFRTRGKLKVAPFDNKIKQIMLDCLSDVHLPMHKYSRVANNVAFVDFRNKLASKVVSRLEAEHINPNVIKRAETYINKLTR